MHTNEHELLRPERVQPLVETTIESNFFRFEFIRGFNPCLIRPPILTGEIPVEITPRDAQYLQPGPVGPERDVRMVRFNHARAKAQCRSTVRGASSRAAAISGTFIPTK